MIYKTYIYDFGIFIEVAPDEEQRQLLEQNINMALSKGDINLEDAIDIRQLKNLKLANQLLKLKRRRKQEEDDKKEAMKQAMAAAQNLKSQQMAGQISQQKIQMEAQAKMQYRQADVAFEIEKLKVEAELKAGLMDKEFEMNMQLRNVDAELMQTREKERETSKSARISQQNTQQSNLINQKKNNLPPQSFESNEDSLDGFDMAEFDPR